MEEQNGHVCFVDFVVPWDQSAIPSTGPQNPIQHTTDNRIQANQRGCRLHATYLSNGSSNYHNDCKYYYPILTPNR